MESSRNGAGRLADRQIYRQREREREGENCVYSMQTMLLVADKAIFSLLKED